MQVNRRGINESELFITVDYDTATRSVESIKSVEVYNHIKNIKTDVTAIFSEQFDGALESMIDQIDWDEVFLSHIDVDNVETYSEAI